MTSIVFNFISSDVTFRFFLWLLQGAIRKINRKLINEGERGPL